MKTNTILPDMFKAIGMKVNKLDFVAESGFFLFWGMLAGIMLNDFWRIFHLPGEGIPITVAGHAQTLEIDFIYQLIIGFLVMFSSAFGVKYGFGFGSGILLGSTLANQVESGDTLTLLPFNLPPKTT